MRDRLKKLFDSIYNSLYMSIFAPIWWQQTKMLSDFYFCGHKIIEWIQCDGFMRFTDWAGLGMCHELSALAMVIFRKNKTAILYQGYDYNGKGKLTKHAWVEFRIPLFGWYVCDLMWLNGFAKRRRYRKWFPQRTVEWRCTYDEFWSIPLSHDLYRQMQLPGTSYVVDELTLYIADEDDKFGFTALIKDIQNIPAEKGQAMYMVPVEVGDEICWVTTLRDFVRNPKAKSPRMRSIRMAEGAYRNYMRYLSDLEKKGLIGTDMDTY